jgi:hypothetical protein
MTTNFFSPLSFVAVRTGGGGREGCIVLYIVPVQDEREWEAELEGELNEFELVEEERAV